MGARADAPARRYPPQRSLVGVWFLAALTGAGCVSSTSGPASPSTTAARRPPAFESCTIDLDCDGIIDAIDRRPVHRDLPDVDGDGLPNAQDPYPYVAQPAPKDPVNDDPAPRNTNPYDTGQCTPGLKPDSDGDGVPDACDPFFDPNVRDTDRDGIPDSLDDYPNDNDSNRNGRDDGNDPDYIR